MAKAKAVRVNLILMPPVELLTPVLAWHCLALYHMTVNKASLIIVKGDQLPDATTMASLAISLSNAGVTQMYKMPGSEVSIMATKAMAMIMVLVMVIERPVVRPMPWMPMSSRGILLISFKVINQGLLAIIFIGLMKLSQIAKFRNYSLQSIA